MDEWWLAGEWAEARVLYVGITGADGERTVVDLVEDNDLAPLTAGGCGCASRGGAGASWLLLLPMAAIGRRVRD